MTNEQFERWMDFSLRMARTCFKEDGTPPRSVIVELVEDYFGSLNDDDIPCYVDWDNSRPYAEDSPCYRKTRRCECWDCKGVKKPDCRWNCEDGWIFEYATPCGVGDDFSTWSWDNIIVRDWMDEIDHRWAAIHEEIFGDDDLITEPIFDSIRDPVHCCVRAGLDIASAPSAGVIGFTAGDLRRMYAEGLPDWVKGAFTAFDEIKDDQGVWL